MEDGIGEQQYQYLDETYGFVLILVLVEDGIGVNMFFVKQTENK